MAVEGVARRTTALATAIRHQRGGVVPVVGETGAPGGAGWRRGPPRWRGIV